MDFRYLRSFVAVAEELSFRRAAERLHLSQPPLSRQIKFLEDELGVRLLERGRASKVSLTDAGQTFLPDARRMLALTAAAQERTREAARGKLGRLNVANISSLSATVLPPLLSAFRKKFPQVQISLLEMKRNQPLAALSEGRIHVGIFPDLGEPLDREFQAQPLFSCPMVAVLPARHKLVRDAKPNIGVEALAAETLIVPSTHGSPGYFDRLQQLFARTHFNPVSTQAAEGLHNLLGMVAAGYGVAILPEVLVNPPAAGCATRRLRAPVPSFQLKLFWLRNSRSLVLKNFLAVAKTVAKQTELKRPTKRTRALLRVQTRS